MANDDDDLRLNTLHRFAKHSQRLVLEEHTHCEVPAGCGGVVLRWINPDAGVPAVLHAAVGGSLEVRVDGAPLAGGRVQLAFGPHLLALRITPDAAAPTPFLFAGMREAPEGARDAPALLTSAADGTWLCTITTPNDDWASPDLDERAWRPLPLATSGTAAVPEAARWRFDRLVRLGAIPLALPPGAGEAWVRKRFRVEREAR